MQIWAADVDLAMAKATAQRFLTAKAAGKNLQANPASGLKLLYTEENSSMVNKPVFYVFNTDRGFIIISADDRAQEVLAHGDRPLNMDRMPINMRFWLNYYKRQIEFLQARPGLRVDKPATGNKNFKTPTVEPLLTAMWDQEAPYYNQCKFNNYLCLTGCPATSLSMVFYYWKYPTDPTPEVEGYTNTASNYGFEIPALPSITFDWDNMLDVYTSGNYNTAQANAVAWLMRYVGQEEQMEYTPSGSGAFGDDILRAVKFFGYDEDMAQLIFKATADNSGNETELINDTDWAAMLQNELAEGRPVVYCAYDYSYWYGWSGHAFNVDGYNATDNTYHVNWGWSGEGNGDYALNAFSSGGYTFNIEQQMVMGIQPPAKGPSIKVRPAKLNMECFAEQSTTATFTVTGSELTSAVSLTLNDESGYFSIDANSIAVSDLTDGKVITVTYAPQTSGTHSATITLSNPDAEDKVVSIDGVSTLQTVAPVMQPANETYVNLTQFRADWTDETADKYVDSYTLQVNTKPSTQLIEMQDFSDYPEISYNQASNADQYMPEGWTFEGSGLWLDGGCIEPSQGSTITTGQYDLSGYEKVTVVVTFKSWSSWNNASLTVATSKADQTFTSTQTYADYTAVLECGDTENIVFTAGYYPMIQKVMIYAGELTQEQLRAIAEEGDTMTRLITGITDKHYTIKNLEAGETFYFRVKANYIDGTMSAWSNTCKVTLFENGHGYELGDVNHDETVDISDVTELISYILGSSTTACTICGDMNGDTVIDISDVTELISKILS